VNTRGGLGWQVAAGFDADVTNHASHMITCVIYWQPIPYWQPCELLYPPSSSMHA
jgi:hypothetical protein